MGATTFYAWPYPDPGSTVDVPRDIGALARGIDTSLKTVADTVPPIRNGTITMNFAAVNQMTGTGTFVPAFSVAPVNGGVVSFAQNLNRSSIRILTITTTAIQVVVWTTDGGTITANTTSWYIVMGNIVTPKSLLAAPISLNVNQRLAIATCHIDECPVQNIAIPDVPVLIDDASKEWAGVTCGGCSNLITDIE
jgi:hypothetical protein